MRHLAGGAFPLGVGSFRVGPGDIKMAARTLELAVTTLGAKHIALLRDNRRSTAMQGAKNLKNEKFAGTQASTIVPGGEHSTSRNNQHGSLS